MLIEAVVEEAVEVEEEEVVVVVDQLVLLPLNWTTILR
jgi:hypothetical protein